MCLPVKLKKTAVQQPLPPKTAISRRKLTFSCHIRRIFDDHDLFFLPFIAELDKFESYDTKLSFFLKSLLFAFDTFFKSFSIVYFGEKWQKKSCDYQLRSNTYYRLHNRIVYELYLFFNFRNTCCHEEKKWNLKFLGHMSWATITSLRSGQGADGLATSGGTVGRERMEK